MTLHEIIKRALTRIKKEGKTMTPAVYEEVFCKEAKLANVAFEECRKVEHYLSKLPPKMRRELRGRHIVNADQLIQYLGAEFSRHDPKKSSETIQAYFMLSKRVLQAVTLLHDREAAQLAKEDLASLGPYLNREEIDGIRERWNSFVIDYDDALLKEYSVANLGGEDDFRSILSYLLGLLEQERRSGPLPQLVPVITAALAPSIAQDFDRELAETVAKVEEDPQALAEAATLEVLQAMVKRRIRLDREEIGHQLGELDALLMQIGQTLGECAFSTSSSQANLHELSMQLDQIDGEHESFSVVHRHLQSIARKLEEETQQLNQTLVSHEQEVTQLQSRVKVLEEALRKERRRSQTDTLTKLPNRRAMEEFLHKTELTYQRYGKNYAVVLFDIDEFKQVNDTYGHDAGDVILAAFAKLLGRYSRELDFIARYGGEEFLVILPHSDGPGAELFAEKLRDIVEKSKFMYKNGRIPITVSGGGAARDGVDSEEALVKRADENLYKAKENGRNQIVFL